MSLMKPIYNRLGSHDLFTRKMQTKLCTNSCGNFGTSAVKCGASLAVCQFNDGVSSFFGLAESLVSNTSNVGLSELKLCANDAEIEEKA